MTQIRPYSLRCQHLDHAFLSARLKEARSYTRIAGYFRSSIQYEPCAALSAESVFSRTRLLKLLTGDE